MFRLSLILSFVFLFSSAGCDKINVDEEQTASNYTGIFGELIDDWTFKITPYGNFDIGEFRLWIPENSEEIKAILVLCGHHNSDATGLTKSEHWQEFAIREKLGILGVHFKSYPGGQGYYSTASEGSGSALIRALDTLGQLHNLNELSDLPFLMRGYSAGGVFAYNFTEYLPERVLAFSNIRGGSMDYTDTINNGIPGLMLMGEIDLPQRNNRIRDIVSSKRREGALWAYAVEPDTDHYGGLNNSDELIKAFFSKVLSKRLDDELNNPHTIYENSGWLGNNETNAIYSFDSYPEPKGEASWLIDNEFAILWKKYQNE